MHPESYMYKNGAHFNPAGLILHSLHTYFSVLLSFFLSGIYAICIAFQGLT